MLFSNKLMLTLFDIDGCKHLGHHAVVRNNCHRVCSLLYTLRCTDSLLFFEIILNVYFYIVIY